MNRHRAMRVKMPVFILEQISIALQRDDVERASVPWLRLRSAGWLLQHDSVSDCKLDLFASFVSLLFDDSIERLGFLEQCRPHCILEQILGCNVGRLTVFFSALWQRMSPKVNRSEEHTSELQSQSNLVCPL